MEKGCVYGIDLSKPVSAVQVRDAVIKCFIEAHKAVLDDMKEYESFSSEEEFESIKKIDVKFMIESFFKEVNGDYDNPTKESLVKVIEKLKEYSAKFRNQKIVEKHAKEIGILVAKLS